MTAFLVSEIYISNAQPIITKCFTYKEGSHPVKLGHFKLRMIDKASARLLPGGWSAEDCGVTRPSNMTACTV